MNYLRKLYTPSPNLFAGFVSHMGTRNVNKLKLARRCRQKSIK